MMLLALLLLPAAPEEMTLSPKVVGDVTASLSVRVADQSPQPGMARVRIHLTVEGPSDLVVEGPWLEDALSGWRVPLRTSSVRLDGREWEYTLELVQVKPGVVPLPGVRLRVHTGGSSEEIAWPDLLNEPANVAPVAELAPLPASPWPRRLRWAGFVLLGVIGLFGAVLGVWRWAARPGPALLPAAAAMAAVDRVQQSQSDPLHLVAELDGILRVYLETLGIPATRMTGMELHARLGEWPGAEEFASILTQGEELKFAGTQVSSAQVRALANGAKRILLVRLDKEGSQG